MFVYGYSCFLFFEHITQAKNIVEQVKLKKWPNDGSMGNIHQLKDISMRPKLGRGRRTNGSLQVCCFFFFSFLLFFFSSSINDSLKHF